MDQANLVWLSYNGTQMFITSNSFISWFLDSLLKLKQEGDKVFIWIENLFMTCWLIRKGRNSFVFDGESINPLLSLHKIRNSLLQLGSLKIETQRTNTNYPSIRSQPVKQWIPPRHNFIKTNTDATFDEQSLNSYLVMVARDFRGNVVTVATS